MQVFSCLSIQYIFLFFSWLAIVWNAHWSQMWVMEITSYLTIHIISPTTTILIFSSDIFKHLTDLTWNNCWRVFSVCVCVCVCVYTHTQRKRERDVCGVMVIIIENKHSKSSSNPGQDGWHFTYALQKSIHRNMVK